MTEPVTKPALAERAGDLFHTAGRVAFPCVHHLLHLLALQVLLRAAEVAGDDGERLGLGVGGDVVLAHIGQRADHHVFAVVAEQLGRHAADLGMEEQIEEERGHQVVTVVAQRDLGVALLLGEGVQRAAA